MTATEWICIAVFVVLAGWDVYLKFSGKRTISKAGRLSLPIIPATVGVIAGHIFWRADVLTIQIGWIRVLVLVSYSVLVITWSLIMKYTKAKFSRPVYNFCIQYQTAVLAVSYVVGHVSWGF